MQYVKITQVFRIPVASGNYYEAKTHAIQRWNEEGAGKFFEYQSFHVEEEKGPIAQVKKQLFG